MDIIVATRNKGKLKEIKELLKDIPVNLLSLNDFKNIPEVKEDGFTFQENALIKAKIVAEITGFPVLSDDSGLEIDALNGQPGIHSARFSGDNAKDSDNIRKVLDLLGKLPEKKRLARFRAVACLHFPDGKTKFTEGTCEGKMIFAPRGENGFGYDPIFMPKGYKKTFAELDETIKNCISHRAKAMEKMKKVLKKIKDAQ
ncbi:MAG: XTP/dITP diphosphatase [bacterium]|nr:XTP/dITP diphosphatase [bacterium]